MKSKLLYSLLFAIPLTCILVIIFFVLRPRQNMPSQSLPTVIPTQVLDQPTPYNKPAVMYNVQGQKKLVELDKERATLSSSDQSAKDALITQLGGKSGTLTEESTYKATYTKFDDSFEVEIRSVDIAQAKQNAISWFLGKGISQTGLCQLPLSFYLSSTIMAQLQNLNLTFNPLPDFCK